MLQKTEQCEDVENLPIKADAVQDYLHLGLGGRGSGGRQGQCWLIEQTQV